MQSIKQIQIHRYKQTNFSSYSVSDYEDLTTKIRANNFENHLLSIKTERQEMVRPNCHPTYNRRHQKIIEMIDGTLEKYKANIKMTNQENGEQEVIIIEDIIQELDKKRKKI